MSDLKIGIVGCAGVGKSSLARLAATEFGLSCIEAKSITQSILKRDGYDYACGIQIERFLANTGRQNEILRKTLEQEDTAGSFVSDRTVVDLAAYVLCEMHDSDPKTVRNVIETCRRRASDYTHLFLCPWLDKPVSNNQRRTLNPWYQFMIHTIEVGLLKTWDCRFVMLGMPELQDKLAMMRQVVGP